MASWPELWSGYIWPVLWIVLKILAIVVPLLLSVAYLTYFERKVIAAMQLRRGPNVVGPYGLLQPIAGRATRRVGPVRTVQIVRPVVVLRHVERRAQHEPHRVDAAGEGVELVLRQLRARRRGPLERPGRLADGREPARHQLAVHQPLPLRVALGIRVVRHGEEATHRVALRVMADRVAELPEQRGEHLPMVIRQGDDVGAGGGARDRRRHESLRSIVAHSPWSWRR